MNGLMITKSILSEIYDDKSFKDEVAALINSLIDSELQKEEPDFDFIDECVDALIEVQSGNPAAVIPFIAENKFKDEDKKRRVLSILLACAVVLSLSFGAVAINHTVEKKKEEQKTSQTTQTVTEQTTASTTSVKTASTSSAEISPDGKAVRLNLKFASNFKSDYKKGEKLSLNGITVTVEYSDGTKKKVSINDCKIIKSDSFGKDSFVEKVTVEYAGVRDSFFVTFGENVTGFEITHYTGFEKSTEAPKILTSSQYVEVKTGQSISVPMTKNNDGFVCFTADNNNLSDVSISYQGGVNGRQIYLNVTAGSTPGTTTILLAYERNPNDIMARVTVRVPESVAPPESEPEAVSAENIQQIY